jgi:thymidine phosphorylase
VPWLAFSWADLAIGKVGVMLGAGRQRIEDAVDFAAGVKISAKVGEAVEVGEPLCWIYTNKVDSDLTKVAIERAAAAFEISSAPQETERLIKYFVDKDGVYPYEYEE